MTLMLCDPPPAKFHSKTDGAKSSLDAGPAEGAPDAAELAKVQGKWGRQMKTANGVVQIVKQHMGHKTTVTYLDAKGNVLAEKESEFRLELTGRVRIFTFFNNVVTAGPQKGQADKKPKSYIYRIEGDTFIEVNGLLVDDKGEPNVHIWKRIKE